MQSELNPLDLMNILDVLKNHELYQERLKGIQEATQELNDGKFVKATVEQANAIMEAAKAARDKAENEIVEIRSQLNKDRVDQELRFQKEREDFAKYKKEIEEHDLTNFKECTRLAREREQFESEQQQLRELRDKLGKEYAEVSARREDYVQRVKDIEAVINRQFVAPNT